MKNAIIRFAGAFVLLVFLALALCAQQNQMAMKAQAAYDKKSFAEAGPLLLLAAQYDARNGYVHLYNAACSYALSGQRDMAFYSLDAAIARGWRDRKQTEEDSDLVSLRNDSRWNETISAMTTGTMQTNKDATIETTLNAQGRMGNWMYTGEFK